MGASGPRWRGERLVGSSWLLERRRSGLSPPLARAVGLRRSQKAVLLRSKRSSVDAGHQAEVRAGGQYHPDDAQHGFQELPAGHPHDDHRLIALQSGKIDVVENLRAIRDAGFNGWLNFETSSPSKDKEADLKRNMEILKKAMATAEAS